MSRRARFSDATVAGASKTAPPQYTAKTRGKPDSDLYKATLFLPRPVARRLRELSVERNTSLQQLLMEAVDAWLTKQGQGGMTIQQILDQQAKASQG